jgi:hypothetical protein
MKIGMIIRDAALNTVAILALAGIAITATIVVWIFGQDTVELR